MDQHARALLPEHPHELPHPLHRVRAEKLALDQTKIRKAWGRRNYERKLMTMPLSAASICAFSGNPKYSETIEKAVSHYDYSKLNLGEIFFAEVAWWNSPKNRPIATP